MAVANTNLLELLGKQVSFTYSYPTGQLVKNGTVTSIVVHVSSSPEILIDDQGDFHSLSEISEFQVLDDRSIVDAALTGLITDNKDFIDSLSK